MRRNILLTGLCTMLLGLSSLLIQAQRIVVNVEADKAGMPVSVNIKDAEVGQVLTALFNQTGNKYNVKLEAGVTGNIASLQLAQIPFDEALTTILGSVKDAPAKYTFAKEGNNLYRVASGVASGVESTQPKSGVIRHPNGENIPFIVVTLPPVQNPLTAEANPDQPASKECILAMITLKNIPVYDFSKDLGGDCIEAYETDSGNGNSSNNSNRNRRGNRNNNNNNDFYYDDNGNKVYYDNNNDNNNNNNNYYNDNNNNNNNNNNDYYYDDNGRKVYN